MDNIVRKKDDPNYEKNRAAAYYKTHPDRLKSELARQRNYDLRKFGLTPELYKEKSREQWNVCGICGQLTKCGRRLAVDHNHRTGKVRGLLCDKCNLAIGYFRDSKVLLENAIIYLSKWENNK